MRVAILLCLSLCLGLCFANQEKSISNEYIGVYFLKSLTNSSFSAGDYNHWSFSLYNSSSVKDVLFELSKLTNNVTSCDKSLWLQCGIDVLNCVETCRNGTLGSCIDCLGSAYKGCCPCLEEYVPKIPCQSS